MDMLLFTIYDKVSGIYSEPFTAVNEDVARRRFKQICGSQPILGGDLQLYKLGSFNSASGVVSDNNNVLDMPVFVEGGVANG